MGQALQPYHLVYLEGVDNTTDLMQELADGMPQIEPGDYVDTWVFTKRGDVLLAPDVDDTLYKEDPKRWAGAYYHSLCVRTIETIENKLDNHYGPWPIFVQQSLTSVYLRAKAAFINGDMTRSELDVIQSTASMFQERLKGYIQRHVHVVYTDRTQPPVLHRIYKDAKDKEGWMECIGTATTMKRAIQARFFN